MVRKIFFILFIALAFTASFLAYHRVRAQQTSAPALLISWSAQNYSPDSYHGKNIPTDRTIIAASVELIDKGKVIDISNQLIQWYLDDEVLRSGTGLKEVLFRIPQYAMNDMSLRVKLPDYASDLVFKTIRIPVIRPKVVIDAPFANGQVSSRAIRVVAVPYFFNINGPLGLSYSWSVNGKNPANNENPNELDINIPPDTASAYNFQINVNANDPVDSFAVAASTISLTYVQ